MRLIQLPKIITGLAMVALLAGCGGSQPPIGAPRAMPRSMAIMPTGAIMDQAQPRVSYQVLYSFGRARGDAGRPAAGLVESNGTLYGTTPVGGKYTGSLCPGGGCGTVFSVSTSGKEQVIYDFRGGADGYNCEASLIVVSGTLYGTTTVGGAYGGGTVFSITTTGTKHVLHDFGEGEDGSEPEASLLDVNGTLYGTTFRGGHGGGTVFRISTTGKERVLYSFHGRTDGSEPVASLIDVNDTLYGTTTLGGKHLHGTVFSVSITGKEHVLYSFSGGSDGAYPYGSLLDVKGTLYGTAGGGGSDYHGTLFSIDTTGKLNVLHRFEGSPDGAAPSAALIDEKGILYGTTAEGGKYSSYSGGTVFRSTTKGMERVVHSFGSGSDGADPTASLIGVKDTLYGTTSFGGVHLICSGGCGTVFALAP